MMQTPVEIDFQGLDASPQVRAAIDKHLAQLEERFGRITAGRVVLKAPSGHHRTGGLYEIAVRLSLPDGREVNIGRVRQDDERLADLNYALNDTFKRARRQLQDNARELQGQVKESSGSPLGTVTELDPLGQFGFIKTDDNREIYFPPQQRAGRRLFAAERRRARVVCRGDRRQGPAGQHREAAEQAQPEGMTLAARHSGAGELERQWRKGHGVDVICHAAVRCARSLATVPQTVAPA